MTAKAERIEENEHKWPPIIRETYPYSITIQQTAAGARVTAHCYNQHLELAVRETIEAYIDTRRKLKNLGYAIAPEE